MPERFIAVDWGTSRLRAFRVENGAVEAEIGSGDGIGTLPTGDHIPAFERLCGAWLADEPDLPVWFVGMAGSREGPFPAPYVPCPTGAAEVAAAALPIRLASGGRGFVVPGLRLDDERGGVDVMRGEETLLLGSGVADGLVCLPGTHSKWAEMRGGRIVRFASFVTGELHGLLLQHSMVGQPARDPADPAGFAAGLAAARYGGGHSLLQALFRARAATVAGVLPASRLGPYLSGLLTGDEVAGALRIFGQPATVTVVAEAERAALYAEALEPERVGVRVLEPGTALLDGLATLMNGSH